jgi:sulfite reductase (NADPH) hemoprotein beta-component
VGKIIGPSFFENDIAGVVTKIIDVFVEKRIEGESFQSTYERVGLAPFKERVYAA